MVPYLRTTIRRQLSPKVFYFFTHYIRIYPIIRSYLHEILPIFLPTYIGEADFKLL